MGIITNRHQNKMNRIIMVIIIIKQIIIKEITIRIRIIIIIIEINTKATTIILNIKPTSTTDHHAPGQCVASSSTLVCRPRAVPATSYRAAVFRGFPRRSQQLSFRRHTLHRGECTSGQCVPSPNNDRSRI